MTGYVRKDTTNNIADGNVINANDLDNEFDGIQDAFNSTTGHNHDGTTGEGAPILAVGPTQDVVASATALTPKTTNTVDIGSGSLKFKDLYMAGNASIGGTLAVTGTTTLSGLTASTALALDASKNVVSVTNTGTGNNVLSASPTLTGTTSIATLNLTNALGTSYGGTGLTSFTANGVVYASSTSALATGSALTFDGTRLVATATTGAATTYPAYFDNSGAGVNTGSRIGFRNTGTSYGEVGYVFSGGFGFILDSANSGDTRFLIGGSEQMRLTSTGLGIGTSSPAVKLDVAGSASAGIRYKSSGNYGSVVADNTGTTGGGSFVARQNGTQYAVFGVDGSIQGNTSTDTAIFADGTGSAIKLYTNGSPTLKATLDSSGNLGLGVTPSAWSGAVALASQVGWTGVSYGSGDGSAHFTSNVFFNGAWTTIGADYATKYSQVDGTHSWSTSTTSKSANTAAGFTQAMTLDASGNLLVGNTSLWSSERLGITGSSASQRFIYARTTANGQYLSLGTNGTLPYVEFGNGSGLAFNDGATERARIDSSGNLLVGTTSSPNSGEVKQLIANSSGGAAYLQFQNVTTATGCTIGTSGENFIVYTNTNTIGGGGGSYSERARIDSSGNLGIGVTNPSSYIAGGSYLALALNGTNGSNISLNGGGGQIGLVYAATGNSNLYVTNQTASGNLIFGVGSGTERARIDSSGNLLVGTTSAISSGSSIVNLGAARQALTVKGDSVASYTLGVWNATTTGDALFSYFATEASITVRGSITYNRAGGLTVYNTTSDYRAKDISGPVTDSGALIDSVPVYMGKMKGATQERPMFIAHETPAYAHTGEKDAVDKDGNPVYQQMDASALIPVMWAEIQSLRKRLADAGI